MTKVHQIKPGPRRSTETVVPYYQHAGEIIKEITGHRPSRQSLNKYLTEHYAVVRLGPKVKMPVFRKWDDASRQNGVYTTVEAMQRWAKLVGRLRWR